jgi:hypothetical protein
VSYSLELQRLLNQEAKVLTQVGTKLGLISKILDGLHRTESTIRGIFVVEAEVMLSTDIQS